MDFSNKKKYCNDMKNVRQWLHSTKTRCDSLKSHMEYMKMLYHDIPKMEDTKKPLAGLKWHSSKVKDAGDHDIANSKHARCNSTFDKISDGQCEFPNDDVQKHQISSIANAMSVSSKPDLLQKGDESPRSLNYPQNGAEDKILITPRAYSVPQNVFSSSHSLSAVRQENTARCKDPTDNWQEVYQKHLLEYPGDLQQAMGKKSFQQLIMDNGNEYLVQELSSARDNMKLNISEGVKGGSLSEKAKAGTKGDKKERGLSGASSNKKGSLSKLDDVVSLKFKKRRRKVHSSNSRSTVMTKDTNFVGKKDVKKRKQKNNSHNQHTFKAQQTSNEVVEIYHNAAAKGAAKRQPKCETNGYQCMHDTDTDNEKNYSETHCVPFNQKPEGTSTNDDLNYNLEVSTTPVHAMKKCSSHQCQRTIIQTSYCNPIITHNYEMPTLASKLKRANRSYFSRFHFQNIPFVVGTSVTPSHNLGLNIQQVLSIMKTRQSTATGITPLLIRKISRGMKPASILMEEMSGHRDKLPYMNSLLNDTHEKEGNLMINDTDRSLPDTNPYLKFDRKPDTRSENQLNLLNAAQTFHSADNNMLKLFASQQNMKAELGMPNMQTKIYQESMCEKHIYDTTALAHSQDPKGIREVLVNLHDQFEEMNTKYEKLQAKAKESNDKDLEEEVSNLEKELSVKEDEINAVVNLYKEVMALKHQMRLLQEKKSYVCISTEIPIGSNKLYSTVPFSSNKSYGSGFQQRFQNRRGTNGTREPTSLRLAGLLRQIQTFQKQLKVMSW